MADPQGDLQGGEGGPRRVGREGETQLPATERPPPGSFRTRPVVPESSG